jgi:predicted aspartyl protease
MPYRAILYTMIASAIVYSNAPAPALADGCSHRLFASAEAELGPYNQLLIHAKIDDQPVMLALDTGAAASVMFENAVDRFSLTRTITPSSVVGIDGRPLDLVTSVPSLAVGNAVSRGTLFPVAPVNGMVGDQVVGLFGSDYLGNYDVEIDLADHKVNLFAKDHCPGKVVYWSDSYFASDARFSRSGQIEFEVQLDGKTLTAMLDTGASETALRLSAAGTQFGISPDSQGVVMAGTGTGVGGKPLQTYSYAFKSLAFGGLTMHNPKIAVIPFRTNYGVTGSHIQRDDTPDMLIGMNVIRRLRLYIAYGEGRLYYTVAQPS